MLAYLESQLVNPGCLAAVQSADAIVELRLHTLSFLWCGRPLYMFVAKVFLLIFLIRSHHTDTAETGAKAACTGTTFPLVAQKRLDFSDAATNQTASSSFGFAPLSGPFGQCSASDFQPVLHSHDKQSLEVRTLQETCEEGCRILPQLWWTLDKDPRRQLWAGFSQPLGMGQLGRHSTEKICYPAEIDVKTSFSLPQEGESQQGQRKGKAGKTEWTRQGQQKCGECSGSLTFRAIPCCPTDHTMAHIGSSKQYNCDSSSDADTDARRTHHSPEEGVPRWHAGRGPGVNRSRQRIDIETAHQRPPCSHYGFGEGPQGLQRGPSSRAGPQTSLAASSEGSHKAVAGTTGPLQEEAGSVPRSKDEGGSRSGDGEKDNPSSELSDNEGIAPSTHGRGGGGQTGQCGCAGGRRPEEGAANHTGCLCGSYRSDCQGPHRGDPDLFRRGSRKSWPSEKNKSRARWNISCFLVTIGRVLACPQGIAERAWPDHTMQDVEAYVNEDSCAAGIRWHQTAQHCGYEVTLESLYRDQWCAQQTAMVLRGDVLQDYDALHQCDGNPIAQHHAPRPCRNKKCRQVSFEERINVHIFHDDNDTRTGAITLGLTSLQQWSEKPWSLHPNLAFDDRGASKMRRGVIPLEVESDNDSLDQPLEAQFQNHTPEWTDDRYHDQPSWPFVEAIQEAISQQDQAHLSAIAELADGTMLLNIRTYGYFVQSRGERDLQIPTRSVSELFQRVAELWADWSDPSNLQVYLVTPQPDADRTDIYLLVGDKREEGHLVLTDIRGDDQLRAAIKPDHPANALDLVAQTRGDFDETANYTTRKGGVVWMNFVSLPLAHGQCWQILQTHSEPLGLSLMQHFTTLVPKHPHFCTWRTNTALPEEYHNLLDERNRHDHQFQLAVGPVTFEREEEWVRILADARQRQMETFEVHLHGLFGEDAGTYYGELPQPDRAGIEAMILTRWPQFAHLRKKIFIVHPQPDGPTLRGVTLLVEFEDGTDPPHIDVRPILEEVIHYEDCYRYQCRRTAIYLTTGSSFEDIVDGIHGCDPFHYDHRCDVWLGGQPIRLGDHPVILSGSLLTVRVLPQDEAPSDFLRAYFQGAAGFEQYAIVASSRMQMTTLQWVFHIVGGPGEPHRQINLNVPWIHAHSANYILQMLRQTGRLSLDAPGFSCTMVRNLPLEFSRLEFLCGVQPESYCLVMVIYSQKWDETWTEPHCHNLPRSTTPLGIAGLLRLERFTSWTIFKNGRVVAPDLDISLRPGDIIEVELEDSSAEDDVEDDTTTLMQRASPSTSPTLVSARLIGLHSTIATVDIDTTLRLSEEIERKWPFRRRRDSDLFALHPVQFPPRFNAEGPERVYLLEFRDDSFEQVHEDDVMVLFSIVLDAPNAGSSRKQRVKALWAPHRTTREQLFAFLRVGWFCNRPNFLCFLYLNNVPWPQGDQAIRALDHGDHIHLNMRSERYGWCDLEYSEATERSRRVFVSSDEEPPPELQQAAQEEEEEEEEDLSPYTVRSRSRERDAREDRDEDSDSLLQLPTEPYTPPAWGFSGPAPGRQQLPPPVDPLSVVNPHVSDLWCETQLSSDHPKSEDSGAVSRTTRRRLNLDRLIPEKVSREEEPPSFVRILAPPMSPALPYCLEVFDTIDSESIKTELANWGHLQVEACLLSKEPAHPPIAVVRFESQPEYILFIEDTSLECTWHELQDAAFDIHNEIETMRLLGNLGKPRSAVLEVIHLLPGTWGVRYANVAHVAECEQAVDWHMTPLPPTDKRSKASTFTERIQSQAPLSTGGCVLRPAHDLDRIRQLFTTADCLQTTFGDIQLPLACQDAITATKTGSKQFDRLRIYVDGSSNPAYKHWEPELVLREGQPDAWAFVVVGETYGVSEEDSDFTFLGFATQPVCYEPELPHFAGADRIGSDVAEREALLWGGLWRLALNDNIPTIFLSDSTTAGSFAFGRCGTATPTEGHRLTRGVLQALSTLLPGDALQLCHVKGHSGEIWNECCDALAKWSSTTVHWLRRQDIDLRCWRHILPTLWWYFDTDQSGLPPMDATGVFHPKAPELPDKHEVQSDRPAVSKLRSVRIELSLATANVQTLGKGPDGHFGKLDYLQQQFATAGIGAVGVQEARTDEIFSGSGTFLRLASGSNDGHHGVELWLSTVQPIGYLDDTPWFFRKKDICVLHRDPRRLLVRTTNEVFDGLFLVLHAPQSGREANERQEWWTDTNALVQSHLHLAPLFVLGDMNATTGPADHIAVFRDDGTSPNTEHLRVFAEESSLAFPSTTDIHHGKEPLQAQSPLH